MKKLLFVLAIICVFSCEPIDTPIDECITCTIRVYSPSNLMTERKSVEELCTDEEKAQYPIGVHASSACNDCRVQIGCI